MQTKDLKELKKKLLPYLVEAKWIGLDNHCLPKKFHDTVYLFQDGKVLIQLIDHAIQSAVKEREKEIKKKLETYVWDRGIGEDELDSIMLNRRELNKFVLSELSKKEGSG